MIKDLRESALYREAEALYIALRRPGTGQISDAVEVHVAPDDRHAVFAGTIIDRLDGPEPTRICQVDLESGETRVLTFGPNTDRRPRYSPDGRHIAFLSDRDVAGDFQLFLLESATGILRAAPRVEGWIEYLHWSPDGRRILLGVAGHRADVSSGQGALTINRATEAVPSWMPTVDAGVDELRWRRAWVYELEQERVRQVSAPDCNVWEGVWCGNGAFAAVISAGSGEGLWYSARLAIIEIETGRTSEIFTPQQQLGWPAASPSGQHLAIVEAISSDRWLVAGDLHLIDVRTQRAQGVDTHGVDITYTEWRSDQQLLLAGHRGFETVVGVYDVPAAKFTQTWTSRDVTTGGFHVSVAGFNQPGDCVLVGEGFVRSPEIGMVREGRYLPVRSFDLSAARPTNSVAAMDCVTWRAPDGLEIQGWLLRPQGAGPHPLVMNVHGGPVWHWRPLWLGRPRTVPLLMLLEHGYAVFFPNPRGSAGRGQDFARRVIGDMGGADAHDCLSGLDHLVTQGIADPTRLGVTGVSYGGYMTAWLTTQDSRFVTAVAVAPAINRVSQHLTSNIPHFVSRFLADRYDNPAGRYFSRSPVMHARKSKTPTLNICGALDRCTPPTEAMQFHNALLENHVKSVLVTYPEEGHGVRRFPAAFDYAARVVSWFEEHMGR